MKKIGVITFLTTKDNYGQILQAFALQYVLRQMKCDPFIINYKKRPYKIWWKRIILRCIYFIYPNWHNKQVDKSLEEKNKNRKFEEFIINNITRTDKEYHSLRELKKDPPIADIYITGSDQVWAQLISDYNNKAYFLDFGSTTIKRIAYAPSFAMSEYPTELIPELKKLLKIFSAISVREKNGIEICKSAGRIDTEVVLDPTLLLEGKIYRDLFIKPKVLDHEYLFIYSLNILSKEEIEWDSLKQYAQNSKLNILVTPSSGVYPAKELFEKVTYSYCTIENWLSNIAYSKLTVTTSFHGIVFCILLNKNFVYIPLKNSFSRANSRIIDLLETLDLKNKIYTQAQSFEKTASSPIDWEKVNNTLNEKRIQSLLFLKNAIK